MRAGSPDRVFPGTSDALAMSGYILGLGLPLAMFFANRSSVLVVAVAALTAFYGVAVQQGQWPLLRTRLGLLRQPVFIVLGVFVLFCGASVAWSNTPKSNLFSFGEFVAGLASTMLLGWVFSVARPAMLGRHFAIGIALASVFSLLDLATGMSFRDMLGIRPNTYVLNRTTLTLAVIVWPMILLLEKRDRWIAGAAFVVATIACLKSESTASVLGILTGTGCAVIAVLLPRVMTVIVALGTAAMLALSPWIGDLLLRAIPDRMHKALDGAHSLDRIHIWQSYAAAVYQRPLLGSGFNASAPMASDPVAKVIGEPLNVLLGAGHPHNALLQTWVEMGAVGAGLAMVLTLLVCLRLLKVEKPAIVATLGLCGAALSIAAVSHGAWQGWWIAIVGASIAIAASVIREQKNDDIGR